MTEETLRILVTKIEEILEILKTELPSQQTQTELASEPERNPTTRLVVTMPDGEKIDNRISRQTFFDVITRIGVERVNNCAHELIYSSLPDDSDKYTYWQHGRYYILVGGRVSSTNAKARILRKIGKSLDLNIQVKVVPKGTEVEF